MLILEMAAWCGGALGGKDLWERNNQIKKFDNLKFCLNLFILLTLRSKLSNPVLTQPSHSYCTVYVKRLYFPIQYIPLVARLLILFLSK